VKRILNIQPLDYGVQITILSLIGIGVRAYKDKRGGYSISFNLGLWKLNTYATVAIEAT
jgi:hypothetical protein